MTIEKIQEDFFNRLIELGFSKEKALETISLFFFSWSQTIKEEGLNPNDYNKAVKEFLLRFKDTV